MEVTHPGGEAHCVSAQRIRIDNPQVDIPSLQKLLLGAIGTGAGKHAEAKMLQVGPYQDTERMVGAEQNTLYRTPHR